MRALALLLLLCIGCASAEPRDPSENCAADFEVMARGITACEQSGDQCAYRTDKESGVSYQTGLDSGDADWVCTCGADIHLYWCKPATQTK